MVLEINDCEVIEGCQRGDPDAFRAFFDAYKDKIFSIALRFTGNESTALDIAQEVFLKMVSCTPDLRAEAAFDSWLYRAVVNCCIDNKRRERRWVGMMEGLLDSIVGCGGTPLQDLLHAEAAETVQQAIGSLPPNQRIVVVLRYTEELSYEEIAAIVGCSPGTVASRLNRSHKLLERRLSRLRQTGKR